LAQAAQLISFFPAFVVLTSKMAGVATKDDLKIMIRLARRGKLSGDDGFRYKLSELNKSGFVGEDLDWTEGPYRRSALWEATAGANRGPDYQAIVQLLVEKKANMQFQDFQGRTPLHEACYYGNMSLVDYFLSNGHPIDCKDHFGQTPLFRAVDAGRVDVVDFLVKRKAEPNLLDSDGASIQHLAGFQGLEHNSEWLLYHGAWKNRYQIEERGPAKPWPVHARSIGSYPEPPKAIAPAPAAAAAAAPADVFVTEKAP